MVFVVDKALIVIIFMYAVSTTVLAGQFLIGDVFGFTLVSPVTNVPMKSTLLGITNLNFFQSLEQNATQQQRPTIFSQVCPSCVTLANQVGFWGNVFWEVFLLLTGTYIFQVLVFFGVPGIIVIIILIPYYILLFRAVIGYVKNFF